MLLVLVELTSVSVYFFKTGELFYFRNKGRVKETKAQIGTSLQPVSDNPIPILQLHPYFGYVHNEGYPSQQYGEVTNNYGFPGRYNLPFKKTHKDQFVIGIFGGSVAHQVSLYELKSHVIADAIKRIPYLKDKEIIILNFAMGAYKQPQESLVLSYFLSIGQELDMVINIDGFNEIALAYGNNKAAVDPSMPAGFAIVPLIDLANKDFSSSQLITEFEIWQTQNKLKDALNRLQNCTFATSYTLRWGYLKYLNRQYQAEVDALAQTRKGTQDGNSLIWLNRIDKPLDDSEAVKQIVDLWANSTLMMNEILSARKIPYFEFVQPNQYHATSRHFTEQEMRTAIDKGGLYRDAITKGYPALLSRVESLRASGVNIFSAVNVLDAVNETVYVDNCCHFNDLGLDVLTKYIARSVMTPLESQADSHKPNQKASTSSK